MYDELVKRLRELHPEEFGNAWDFAFACQQAMHEVTDAIEELNKLHKTQKKNLSVLTDAYMKCWIPVTERLPEAGERVLCYCRANIYEVMKMRTNGDWVYDVHHIYMHSFVTHWMPLPEPPKEE